jgi:hypothetical protein
MIAAERVVQAADPIPSALLPKDLRRPLLRLKGAVARGQLAFMERFADVLEEKTKELKRKKSR